MCELIRTCRVRRTMARGHAPRILRGNPPLRRVAETTDEVVASPGSPRGRSAMQTPAATRKSQRVSGRATATMANIGQGGGNPCTPPQQNCRGCSRNGVDNAQEPPDVPADAGAGVKTPVGKPQKFPAESPKKRKIGCLDPAKHS